MDEEADEGETTLMIAEVEDEAAEELLAVVRIWVINWFEICWAVGLLLEDEAATTTDEDEGPPNSPITLELLGGVSTCVSAIFFIFLI